MLITTLRIFFICAAFGLIGFSPSNSRAESEKTESLDQILDMSLQELMEQSVVTPSKFAQKLREAPANIIVINQQQIRERGYFNLLDLLEDLPSVDVNRKSLPGTFNRIAIRGNTGNHKFIIMQNGHRINAPTTERGPIESNFPLFHAKRVEINYGPASALYGNDAFTGVINIITEDAATLNGGELAAAFGTGDLYYTHLNVGKEITDKFDVTFGGHFQDAQNLDLSEAYPDFYSPTNVLNLDGSIFQTAQQRGPLDFGETDSYSAYLEMNYDKRFNFGMTQSLLSHATSIGERPENDLFADDSEWNSKLESYHGKYQFGNGGSFSGTTSINFLRYEILPSSKFTNQFANFGAFKYGLGKKLSLEQQFDYQINSQHTFTGGITAQFHEAIPSTADLTKPFDTSQDRNNQGLFFPGTNDSLSIPVFFQEYETYGFYVQEQAKWLPWFSTTLGLRFDHDSRFGATTNPRVGAVLDVDENTVLKVMYGEAFLAPSPERAFQFFGAFNGTQDGQGRYISNFFFLPNPNLGPEKSRTVEFNLTRQMMSNLVLTLSGYYTEVSNAIFLSHQTGTSTFISGGIINNFDINDNVGTATIFGGDIRFDYQTSFQDFVLKTWGSYSWVDGELDEGDHIIGSLPKVASQKIKGGVTLRYRNKYYLTPRVSWVGPTNHFRSRRGTVQTPEYTLVNLQAGIDQICDHWSLFVNIRNLTDERYFNAGGLTQAFTNSPQDPRRIIVGLRYNFDLPNKP